MKQIYLLRFLAAKLQLFLLIRNTFSPFSSKYLNIIDLNQILPYYIYYYSDNVETEIHNGY